MKLMDFGKKVLLKYGWKEGDGLGKNSDGISKPLKATLKFDKTGLGADQAATDFNNHWWERVFNEAASNVNVQKGEGQVKIGLMNDKDCVEISTKGYSMEKLKSAKKKLKEKKGYDNFLQASILTNQRHEVENPDKISSDDIKVTKVKVLTDEELYEACGGRTAHKGARHGLNQSGKLSRIEQQEKELLAKMVGKVEAPFANDINLKNSCKEGSSKPTHSPKIAKLTKRKSNTHLSEQSENPHIELNKKKRKHIKEVTDECPDDLDIQCKKNKDNENITLNPSEKSVTEYKTQLKKQRKKHKNKQKDAQ